MNPTLSKIFLLQSRLVMVGWFILICLPFWEFGKSIVGIVILSICITYVYLLLLGKRFDAPGNPPKGSFFSLKGVMRLFEHPRSTLVGWIHILAFDLFVGLYIVSDAHRWDISHWMLIPILIATLMLGPSGLLLYFLLRAFYADSIFDFGIVG